MQPSTRRLRASSRCRDHGEAVIRRALDEIRLQPSTLGLWAFRLAQWINLGRFDYADTWSRIEAAAIDAGACEAWARRTLYQAFADSKARDVEPLPLAVLAGALH